jgi:hypothetical protein
MFFKKIPQNVFTGLLPSPPDDRDFPLSGVMPDIKRYPEEMPRAFDLTITNQGSTPHCVGHAGATIKQYMELKERNALEPDGDWLYKECKKIDGMPNQNGTYFRAVLKVLRDTGCKMKNTDTDPSYYRIAEYRKIDDLSFENLKKTLFVYGHALGGWTGSNAGWAKEVLRAPKPGEKRWGHATALTHYFKDYIGGQNSWGEDKHKDGLFKAPETYLPYEGWVIINDKINEPSKENQYGWVARFNWSNGNSYLDGNITTVNLRVRDEAGLNNNIVKVLPKGTRVNFAQPGESILQEKIVDGYSWKQIII